MDVPLEVCEARDAKGLYKLARAGKIKGHCNLLSFSLDLLDDLINSHLFCSVIWVLLLTLFWPLIFTT